MAGGSAKLALGAAQFGLNYGVSNTGGRTPDAEVAAILQLAADHGVELIDVAPAYGDAETTLGATLPSPCPFKVVTKTLRTSAGLDVLEHAAQTSLANLWLPSAYGLLVHAAADLEGADGSELWARLERLKAEGLYERIGFSTYADDDILCLARRYKPDIVQLPVSLLDQRLVADGTVAALADMGVEVHVRSIFLQGLLFLAPDRLPPALSASVFELQHVRRRFAAAGADPLVAAVRFALSVEGAAQVVVGVTSRAELEEVLAAAAGPSLDLPWSELALDDPVALDPRRWTA